jgi:hypothetical protein
MTENLGHEPHGHCHHHVTAAECTLCSYMALERFHDNRVLEILEEQAGETTARPEEAGEEGQSAGVADIPHP